MRPVLLVLRPEPGAAATAARAAGRGMACVVAPLFTIDPVDWAPPAPEGYDAIMLTSANAVRHAGADLARYRDLPVHAVGEATAAAARAAGMRVAMVGEGDGAELLARIAATGAGRVLHLAGREHRALDHPRISVDRCIVYDATPAAVLPAAAERALRDGAVALLHSPRAAALFRTLIDAAGIAASGRRVAAISAAALAAAGEGWAASAIAAAPSDDALLAAAASLCE